MEIRRIDGPVFRRVSRYNFFNDYYLFILVKLPFQLRYVSFFVSVVLICLVLYLKKIILSQGCILNSFFFKSCLFRWVYSLEG